jgi:hypothetical protein
MSQISLGLTNKEKGLGVIKSKVEMHELGEWSGHIEKNTAGAVWAVVGRGKRDSEKAAYIYSLTALELQSLKSVPGQTPSGGSRREPVPRPLLLL